MINKIEKIETFEDLRSEQFGATDGEEQDMRAIVLNDSAVKINEIIGYLNKLKREKGKKKAKK